MSLYIVDIHGDIEGDYEIIKKYEEPTTKNDLGKAEQKTDYTWEDVSSVMDAMEYRTNLLIENIKSEILHFANTHCSGDDINIYDAIKVIDDCCEAENSTTKNDLGVDCVSRQFMYDLGATCIATRNGNGKLIALGAIEDLPSVTPQEPKTEWIPVSERLPEKNVWVLVTFKMANGKNSVDIKRINQWNGQWEDEIDIAYSKSVIAWMPSPEPYKEG